MLEPQYYVGPIGRGGYHNPSQSLGLRSQRKHPVRAEPFAREFPVVDASFPFVLLGLRDFMCFLIEGSTTASSGSGA